MAEPKTLLGKWRRDYTFLPARGFRLHDHMREVMYGMGFLFSEPFHAEGIVYPSMAHRLFEVMAIAETHNVTFEQFKNWAFLSALLHDFGKSSPEFQRMLWKMEKQFAAEIQARHTDPRDPGFDKHAKDITEAMDKLDRHQQLYRHEFLSALLLAFHPEIRRWFREQAESDQGFAYVQAAAFGHHLKANEWKAFKNGVVGLNEKVYLNQLFKEVRRVLGHDFGWRLPHDTAFPALEDWTHPVLDDAATLEKALGDLNADPLFHNVKDDRVSAALKWLTIIADVLGSIDGPGNLDQHVRNRVLDHMRELFAVDNVNYESRILQRATDKDRARIGMPDDWRDQPEKHPAWATSWMKPWQKGKNNSTQGPRNMIATASTGGGKTAAAFYWASGVPSLRLLFCGTTTDAVTMLWQDYGTDEDFLKHFRAWLDLHHTATPEDSRQETLEEQVESIRLTQNFRGYSSEVTFTTADAVLGILTFYRSSVMWLPYILKSQIVFDEIHSYDPTMRAWHQQFLEWFPGIRKAHLSATLPRVVEKEIADRCRRDDLVARKKIRRADPVILRSPRGYQPGPNPEDPWTEQESIKPRYRIHILNDPSEAHHYFDNGTLWFVNTVDRCQRIGLQYQDSVVYHSRFELRHRRGIRKTLEDSFGDRKYNVRVVATQVAEMSLNISALRGISEIAPVHAMIQRLGRVARWSDSPIADVYFYMPDLLHVGPGQPGNPNNKGLPYVRGKNWKTEYDKWEKWIRQFDGKVVSQDDLEKAFQKFYEDPSNLNPPNSVATMLLKTRRLPVREAIVTVPAIHQNALDALGKPPSKKEAHMMAVPARITPEQQRALRAQKKFVHRIFVIDDSIGTYTERVGLQMR